MVRASVGISSGQWYWENTTTNVSYLPIIGVATSAAARWRLQPTED
jgi:hypothetical protein